MGGYDLYEMIIFISIYYGVISMVVKDNEIVFTKK